MVKSVPRKSAGLGEVQIKLSVISVVSTSLDSIQSIWQIQVSDLPWLQNRLVQLEAAAAATGRSTRSEGQVKSNRSPAGLTGHFLSGSRMRAHTQRMFAALSLRSQHSPPSCKKDCCNMKNIIPPSSRTRWNVKSRQKPSITGLIKEICTRQTNPAGRQP